MELNPILRQAASLGVLTHAEQIELVRKAQAGDRRARDLLIRHSIRFVIQHALKWTAIADFEDLVQEGMMGLDVAIEKFDVNSGYRFTTYARWWVNAYVSKRAKADASLIRIGSTELKALDGTGFFRRAQAVVSYDAPIQEDGGDWITRLEDQGANPEEALAERQALEEGAERLEKAMRGFLPREREVFALRVLSEEEDRLTLEEIGQRWGCSRERVRQVEAAAMKKLLRAVGSEEAPGEVLRAVMRKGRRYP